MRNQAFVNRPLTAFDADGKVWRLSASESGVATSTEERYTEFRDTALEYLCAPDPADPNKLTEDEIELSQACLYLRSMLLEMVRIRF
jgi:hypothetical protein